MLKGTVKTYFIERGQGVISEAGGNDIVFHTKGVLARERLSLEQGDPVLYSVHNVRGQLCAINVRKA